MHGTKFRVGDRVSYGSSFRLDSSSVSGPQVGDMGTVLDCDDPNYIGVEFDNAFGVGHDLGGLCSYGYGRWVEPSSIRVIDESLAFNKDVKGLLSL